MMLEMTSSCVHNVKKFDNTGEDLEDLISIGTIGMDKEGDEITLIDILGTESDDVADKVQLKIEKSKIYKYLDILDDREKEVVIGRFESSGVM